MRRRDCKVLSNKGNVKADCSKGENCPWNRESSFDSVNRVSLQTEIIRIIFLSFIGRPVGPSGRPAVCLSVYLLYLLDENKNDDQHCSNTRNDTNCVIGKLKKTTISHRFWCQASAITSSTVDEFDANSTGFPWQNNTLFQISHTIRKIAFLYVNNV